MIGVSECPVPESNQDVFVGSQVYDSQICVAVVGPRLVRVGESIQTELREQFEVEIQQKVSDPGHAIPAVNRSSRLSQVISLSHRHTLVSQERVCRGDMKEEVR